ncbi:MAG: hypothetical protein PHI83_02880 [Sphaerochaetaceae bacterium]|jgi:hypothetical protein|nr:hypothetical protein [Sphaerochaetaceae bacterium]
MKCVACKTNESSMDFRVIEVRTTKTRDAGGRISRVQELCGISEMGACESCIQRRLDEISNPAREFFPSCKYSVLLLIIGILLIAKPLGNAYIVVGAACIAVCIFKIVDFFKKAMSKKRSFARFSKNNARFVAAWECLGRSAIKRDASSLVSFIPITDATMKMKKEDFVNYYGLTHENAGKLFREIHGLQEDEAD